MIKILKSSQDSINTLEIPKPDKYENFTAFVAQSLREKEPQIAAYQMNQIMSLLQPTDVVVIDTE